MKLKLIINGLEAPEDYKLLRTTISTVASLRKTAVLRFNEERLVIISTPKTTVNGSASNTVLHGDTGQLWCTIPKDVFSLYTVKSVRDASTITMEYSCDALLSVFKRYDRAMSNGSSSNMTIKLQRMPEWDNNGGNNNQSDKNAGTSNPIGILSITFEEIVYVNSTGPSGGSDGHNYDNAQSSRSVGMSGSNKVILHAFRVPVKLLFRTQDVRIQEPMINYTQLMMNKLPPASGPFGVAFHNFIKRIERYTNVQNIQLRGIRRTIANNEMNESGKDLGLKIIVNELHWHLEICWNGPLDPVIQKSDEPTDSPLEDNKDINGNYQHSGPSLGLPRTQSNLDSQVQKDNEEEDLQRIDDSEMASTRNMSYMTNDIVDDRDELNNVSVMVERAEQANSLTHEVIIRAKDWKVCSKLYSAFEEIVLAISHDESCVFHCSLDRGIVENSVDSDQMKQKGQIIYYMARSKGL